MKRSVVNGGLARQLYCPGGRGHGLILCEVCIIDVDKLSMLLARLQTLQKQMWGT